MPAELLEKFSAIPVVKKVGSGKTDLLEEEQDSIGTTIFDGMSPIWKMLATGHEKYFATPPAFNAFEQDNPHWLSREIIPWEQLNDAKMKCEEWLDKHSKKELLPSPGKSKTGDKKGKKISLIKNLDKSL